MTVKILQQCYKNAITGYRWDQKDLWERHPLTFSEYERLVSIVAGRFVEEGYQAEAWPIVANDLGIAEDKLLLYFEPPTIYHEVFSCVSVVCKHLVFTPLENNQKNTKYQLHQLLHGFQKLLSQYPNFSMIAFLGDHAIHEKHFKISLKHLQQQWESVIENVARQWWSPTDNTREIAYISMNYLQGYFRRKRDKLPCESIQKLLGRLKIYWENRPAGANPFAPTKLVSSKPRPSMSPKATALFSAQEKRVLESMVVDSELDNDLLEEVKKGDKNAAYHLGISFFKRGEILKNYQMAQFLLKKAHRSEDARRYLALIENEIKRLATAKETG